MSDFKANADKALNCALLSVNSDGIHDVFFNGEKVFTVPWKDDVTRSVPLERSEDGTWMDSSKTATYAGIIRKDSGPS